MSTSESSISVSRSEAVMHSKYKAMIAALAAIDYALGLPEDDCNSLAQTLEKIMRLRAVEDKANSYIVDNARLAEKVQALREALEGVRQYGSDTLSGRTDGPDDRTWQREAVLEMTRRARLGLGA